jgi:hypothetical protein
MLLGKNVRVLTTLVMLGVFFSLGGCMFYAKLADGHMAQVNLSDTELWRFMSRFESLTGSMMNEANLRGERILGTSITEMRKMYNEMMRQNYSSSRNYVDLQKIERKFSAFHQQLKNRKNAAPNAPGVKSIDALFYQLKSEVYRFKRLIENSVH